MSVVLVLIRHSGEKVEIPFSVLLSSPVLVRPYHTGNGRVQPIDLYSPSPTENTLTVTIAVPLLSVKEIRIVNILNIQNL